LAFSGVAAEPMLPYLAPVSPLYLAPVIERPFRAVFGSG